MTREPPVNIAVECALLGAILCNNRSYDLCRGLQAEHFADDVNREIFRACQRRIEAGHPVDAAILWPTFQFTGLLNDVGGAGYLASLVTAMVGLNVAPEYAALIRDLAARRAEIVAAEAIIERAYRTDLDHGDASDTAAWGIAEIEKAALLAGGARKSSMGSAVREALDQAEGAQRGDKAAAGLFTGIPSLDEMWAGLYPGSLDIIGARPKTGKTSLAMQIARNVAGEGRTVLISSLEMSARDLGMVNVSAMAGVSADDLRRGRFTTQQAHALLLAERKLAKLPIEIIDEPRMPLAQAIGEARTLRRTKQLALWIVDHRDLIGRDSDWAKASKLDWFAEITQRLKAASKSLSIPILLLVQISRGVEGREDPRPRLADLSYAGEQDADNVVLLYRPELHMNAPPDKRPNESGEQHANRASAWQQERRAKAGLADLIFAKRRFGPGGICTLHFDGPTTTFGDLPTDAQTDMEFPSGQFQ